MNILKLLFDTPVMLILTLIGLVEAVKVLFIERKKFTPNELWIFGVAIVLGLVLGVIVQVYDSGMPTGFNAWVDLVLYGLFFGVLAPWLYKAAGNVLQKAANKVFLMVDGAIEQTDIEVSDAGTHKHTTGTNAQPPTTEPD